jgi:hypothetical protein
MANVSVIRPNRAVRGGGNFTRHRIELNPYPENARDHPCYASVDQFPIADLVTLTLFVEDEEGAFGDDEDNERFIRMMMNRDQARAVAVALISFSDENGRAM